MSVSKARLERLIAKPEKTKLEKKTIAYYSKLFRATPPWLDPELRSQVKKIYRTAHRKGMTVDHIVPLSSPIVCGLHVPWNLQIITQQENINKSNTWWPDCPFEQGELALWNLPGA